jgi:hypothetical protein
MSQCDSQRIVVPIPTDDGCKKPERMIDYIFSITSWSGECVDGKREGKGVLTWVEENAEPSYLGIWVVSTWRAEGHFVKGKRLGLWCESIRIQVKVSGKRDDISDVSGCTV